MSRALDIDFARNRPRIAPAGLVLLCVALTLVLVSGARLWQGYDENLQMQARVDEERHRSLSKSHPVKVQATPAALLAEKQNLAVLRELTVPWQDLLSIVEDYPEHDVALIGIDQNPVQSQVRITAEAKDFDSMIAYLRYLQSSKLLREAVLNDQQIEANVPGTPVRFQITAVWSRS
ncbi:PilN domain-containing protein [Paraburkholderia sp. MMS20-SJTN17]|uniref:PilN domain-containing protein n=1 Tax=Paraburkholderia translucens TaxID=2886945 RepID=A0ABS8K7Q0_9BURK|nr:PilN domain-containing protein [Paraburkholderia sp. MMS20-SJTN17]MCC8400744.1 PilN domain-containing protein [Paraburkholderia sp. MMS20-SJTN17]